MVKDTSAPPLSDSESGNTVSDPPNSAIGKFVEDFTRHVIPRTMMALSLGRTAQEQIRSALGMDVVMCMIHKGAENGLELEDSIRGPHNLVFNALIAELEKHDWKQKYVFHLGIDTNGIEEALKQSVRQTAQDGNSRQ